MREKAAVCPSHPDEIGMDEISFRLEAERTKPSYGVNLYREFPVPVAERDEVSSDSAARSRDGESLPLRKFDNSR
jgi:hypothetical protein